MSHQNQPLAYQALWSSFIWMHGVKGYWTHFDISFKYLDVTALLEFNFR